MTYKGLRMKCGSTKKNNLNDLIFVKKKNDSLGHTGAAGKKSIFSSKV